MRLRENLRKRRAANRAKGNAVVLRRAETAGGDPVKRKPGQSGGDYLTVRDIAIQFGIGEDKVLRWIHSGELKAFDVSTSRNRRPRWRIGHESLAQFRQARSSRPNHPAPVPVKSRTVRDAKQFF